MFTFFIIHLSLTFILLFIDIIIENRRFGNFVKGFSLLSIIVFICIGFCCGVNFLLSALVS